MKFSSDRTSYLTCMRKLACTEIAMATMALVAEVEELSRG